MKTKTNFTSSADSIFKCNNKWYFPSTSLAASRVNSGAIPKLSNTCPLWWYQHFVLHHHWHCQVSNLWPIIMERLTPQHSQLQGLDKIMGFSHPLHCPLCPCRVLTHYHNQQPVSPWLSSVSWINDVTVTQGVELSYKCNNKWYFPSTSLAASHVNSVNSIFENTLNRRFLGGKQNMVSLLDQSNLRASAPLDPSEGFFV